MLKSKAIVEPKSEPHRQIFEGALHIRGAYFHAFQTNGQIGHTSVGPQNIRWPMAPRSLNPSLVPGATFTKRTCDRCGSLQKGGDVVAISQLTLRWKCNSRWMGCVRRAPHKYVWCQQAI